MGPPTFGPNIQIKRDGEDQSPPRHRVLMVRSNPHGTDALRLEEEQRLVDAALSAGQYRDRFELVTSAATRYTELPEVLQRYSPAVVHFSGHGSGTGGIQLADQDRFPVAVPAAALAGTFRILRESIRCVVLNACFTWPQAEAIGRHVPCVVGTSREISDTIAIEFAGGFYAAIANGKSVSDAFELGRNRIDLGDMRGSDALMLIDRPEGAANRLFLHN